MHLYITRINGMGGTTQYMQNMTANIAHQLGFREMGIYRYNANAESAGERCVRFDGLKYSGRDEIYCTENVGLYHADQLLQRT